MVGVQIFSSVGQRNSHQTLQKEMTHLKCPYLRLANCVVTEQRQNLLIPH